jgi:hypothetical protein
MDQYTHKFTFKIGSDGSKFIEGKMEFNTDDKVTFKITSFSEPIQEATLQAFMDWTKSMHTIFDLYEGISEIKVVKL